MHAICVGARKEGVRVNWVERSILNIQILYGKAAQGAVLIVSGYNGDLIHKIAVV
tara:strand:- start:1269 stop:1433 length:165 start_codon:yes stop_codon:yes gene_type:complete